MATDRPRQKPGPKPAYVRVPTPTYLPKYLHEEVLARAQSDQVAVTWMMTRLVAEALGQPVPAECYPKSTEQQELPLNRAS